MKTIWVRKLFLILSKVLIFWEKRRKNNVPFSQRDTSLVGILTSLLLDENTVQALSSSVIAGTAGNVSTHGNSASCSKTEQIAPPANSERIKG